MTKEIHDILLSRKEAKVLLRIWKDGFDALLRDERKLYMELLDRLEKATAR